VLQDVPYQYFDTCALPVSLTFSVPITVSSGKWPKITKVLTQAPLSQLQHINTKLHNAKKKENIYALHYSDIIKYFLTCSMQYRIYISLTFMEIFLM
jgi:hypothetical protein